MLAGAVPSYYQAAFQQHNRPFALIDNSEGHILDASADFCQLAERSRAELIGTPLTATFKDFSMGLLVYPQGLLKEPLSRAAGLSPVVLHYFQLPNQGPYLISCFPVSSASDTSPEWELIHHLQAQNQHLHQLNQLKSEFIANISHELRTPLTTILGWPEIMLDDDSVIYPEIVVRAAQAIQRDGKLLLKLLEDLIDLSKIEAGQMQLDLQQISINEVIQQSLALMRDAAGQKQIALFYQPPTEALVLNIDPLRITQVLLNYLSNALKFTPQGGRIEVQVVPSSDYITVKVIDNGIGVPQADQRAIFERFIQLQGQSAYLSGSSGIGLALVKNFIEMHGGQVGVHSEPGHGATFFFSLPVLPADEPAPVSTELHPVLPGSVTLVPDLSVLLAEDREDILAVLKAMLRNEKIHVIDTPIYEQVVALAQEHVPDCIILDVPLALQYSQQILQQLRNNSMTASIPVIALTAMVMKGDRERFLKMGYDGYVAKPCSKKNLLEAIQAVTEAKKHV